MKTPEDKAVELHLRFMRITSTTLGHEVQKFRAKQCALICVDEIIKEGYDNNMYQSRISYWIKVKQEIEKL